jgi:nucleoside 2-deoxyribosyltransferase
MPPVKTTKHYVYLCGGINGLTNDQCKNWRSIAKKQLKHTTIDPMRRDYRGTEDEHVRDIVEGDVEDIAKSTVVLANATRPSWGTAMEIYVAYQQGKCVVVVASPPISPWLRYHATHIFPSLEQAIKVINGL